MKTINKRIEDLEGQTPKGNHEYNATIKGFGENCEAHYYRDGIEISQADYFREAPKNQKLVIEWGEAIPPRETRGA